MTQPPPDDGLTGRRAGSGDRGSRRAAGRALVVDHLVEEIVGVFASDPTVRDEERDSLLPVLDAADEHGERMGAFTS